MSDFAEQLFQALKPASPDEQIANLRKIQRSTRAMAEEASIESRNADYFAKFMAGANNED